MQGITNAIQVPYVVPSWSTGTDAEIIKALEKHYRGSIDLHDYWNVGDTRTVSLSAMSATGVGESHAAQDIELVIMDTTCTGFTLTNEQVTPAFIVGQKNSLNETGYMNLNNTNNGGWSATARRIWCNNIYKEAFPSTIKPIFKQFTWKQGSSNGGSSGLTSTNDYFGLAPEKAVTGSVSYAQTDEAALYSQWTWYQTAANKIKTVNGTSNRWYECSRYSGTTGSFCDIYSNGSASGNNANATNDGISPFGCI